MDELTKRRLAHNEKVFRQVNEAREQASASSGETKLEFVCECWDPDCTSRIAMTAQEFERVRQSPDRYIVLPGHELPTIERVVEDRGAFEVVEKDAA
jgi:hypothetical protein